MGLIMFAGLIGSILYSGHVIKNDIQAEMIDKKTQSTFNMANNEVKLKNNFKSICKRSGIKLDKDNNPINKNKINIAIEYLKYQGYTDSDIQYFIKLFNRKVNAHKLNENKVINFQLQQLQQKLNQKSCNTMVIFRKRIYNNDLSPDERINKLLENDLWNNIVDHYSYIHSNGGAKWEEVWTLKVPKDFFSDINKEDLYKYICQKQNVKYSI